MAEYRNGAPRVEPSRIIEAHVQALQHQHASMVEELVGSHFLWAPELVHPLFDAMGVVRTIIRLNDGRECEVTTFSQTGETTATHWVQT